MTAAILSSVLCVTAGAATEAPSETLAVKGPGGVISSWTSSLGASVMGSAWTFNGGSSAGGDAPVQYSVAGGPPPVLGFDFSFFNDTEFTQTFFVMVSLPVAPHAGATKIGATIGGSVTDSNFDGVGSVRASTGESSIFTAFIDGTPWLTLFNAPYVAEVPFTGGTEILGPDGDGLPGPTLDGPVGIWTYISVTLKFDLTAGDRASFTGVFIVDYVPTPAGVLAFLGLGLLRRRRA